MGLRDRLKNKAKRTLKRLRGDQQRTDTPTAAESNAVADQKEAAQKAEMSARITSSSASNTSTAVKTSSKETKATKPDKEKAAEIAAIKDRFTLATKSAPTHEEILDIQDALVSAMKTVHDPEIPVNIYDLGLIYGMDVNESRHVDVRMTLTSPGCPVAQALVDEVQEKASTVAGILTSKVELVWEPPWTKDHMSEEALLELDML